MRAVIQAGPPFPPDTLGLVPGRNLVTGVDELAEQLGPLTSMEADLLTLAAGIFALDLAAKRGEREQFVRDLELVVPVVNYHAFAHRQDELMAILYLLSDDNWIVEFTPRQGAQEPLDAWPESSGTTLLFSGGLDSLAAAVDELDAGNTLQLASHYTRNRVIQTSQGALTSYLEQHFSPRVSRVAAWVTGRNAPGFPFPSDEDRESSQRTRSFLFLVIGAIAARRKGLHEILMIAENGQMAIHLPLTAARIGAFSTHTAHPEFVRAMEQLLSGLLSFPFALRNPYLYRTKAECVGNLVAKHPTSIRASVSCWKSSRQAFTHCGECIPCLVRRIALEYHGLVLPEYARDLCSEDIATLPADDGGKKSIVDLAEFVHWFDGAYSDGKIEGAFPELVNEHIDRGRAIGTYRRFAVEALQVLGKYPGVQGILA